MKKFSYIFAAFALCLALVACSRTGGNSTSKSSGSGNQEIDTSKLKDVTESKATVDDILAAVATGAEQKMLVGADDTVGGVAQRKVTDSKVYLVVTASLGSFSEADKYNVTLSNGKNITNVGSLTKIGENQFQLKYAGAATLAESKTLEVKQASTGKVIFTGQF